MCSCLLAAGQLQDSGWGRESLCPGLEASLPFPSFCALGTAYEAESWGGIVLGGLAADRLEKLPKSADGDQGLYLRVEFHPGQVARQMVSCNCVTGY